LEVNSSKHKEETKNMNKLRIKSLLMAMAALVVFAGAV